MSPRIEPTAPKAHAKAATLRKSAPVFAALGDPTRLRLLGALCAGGAMSITQLTAGSAITRQAVTRHLDILAGAGLVSDVRQGRERLWQFEPTQLHEARRSLEAIGQQWDQALQRLRTAVER